MCKFDIDHTCQQVFCERAKAAICRKFVTVAEDGNVTVLSASHGCIGHVVKSDKFDLLLLSVKDVSPTTCAQNCYQFGGTFRCLAVRSWRGFSAASVHI